MASEAIDTVLKLYRPGVRFEMTLEWLVPEELVTDCEPYDVVRPYSTLDEDGLSVSQVKVAFPCLTITFRPETVGGSGGGVGVRAGAGVVVTTRKSSTDQPSTSES